MKKRVKIPTHRPAALLELVKRVQAKHLKDGDASILKQLKWQEIAPAIEKFAADHERAESLKRQMVKAYEQRELGMPKLVALARNSRDILTGSFSTEMKELGEWGFDVLEVRDGGTETEPGEELKKTA